eukprot:62851-Chlamydomonas_euryale.AAC.1
MHGGNHGVPTFSMQTGTCPWHLNTFCEPYMFEFALLQQDRCCSNFELKYAVLQCMCSELNPSTPRQQVHWHM